MPLLSANPASRAMLRRSSPADELFLACLDNSSLVNFRCACREANLCCSEARHATRWFDLRSRSSSEKPIKIQSALVWRKNWPKSTSVIAEYAVFIVPETLKGIQRAVLRKWNEASFDLFERIVPCIVKSIRELHLYEVNNLDDSVFVPLAGTLEHLELHGCADTSDACIVGLHKLRKLALSSTGVCEGIGLRTAGQALTELSLVNVRPLCGWLELSTEPNMAQPASAAGGRWGTGAGAGSRCRPTDGGGGSTGLFSHMQALTTLTVSYTDDAAPPCWLYDAWVSLPASLTTLRLPEGARLEGRAAQHMERIRHLQLSAFYTTLTDDDFKHFVCLETLALLDARPEIRDGAFAALQAAKATAKAEAMACGSNKAAPPPLTALMLRGCDGITDAGLLSLEPSLRELHVWSTCRVGDASLAHHAATLTALALDTAIGKTAVTEKGLAMCTQLQTLRLLYSTEPDLADVAVTPTSIQALQRLQYLSVEESSCCAVTAWDLSQLRSTLKWARLASGSATTRGVSRCFGDLFVQDLPGLRQTFEYNNTSEWRFTVRPYTTFDMMREATPVFGLDVRLTGEPKPWGTMIKRSNIPVAAYQPPVAMFTSQPVNQMHQ